MWVAECGLRIADCGLRIADCGLRIADCGLRNKLIFNCLCKKMQSTIHIPQSTFRNPHSAIRNPQSTFRNPKSTIRNQFMDSIVSIMQQIAARETEKIFTNELGIVTAIFPHEAESDKNNYQCSVNLKNRKKTNGSDFELRKVPIATHHIGTVHIPNVGDLVVVSFINGDLNAPVIMGRLYNDEQLPPVSKKEELVVNDIEVVKINMKDKKLTLEIDKDGNLTINAFKSSILLKNDKASIEIDKDGNVIINKGDKGAAREGDEVEVEIPAGSFIKSVSGGSNAPALGMPNSPLKVKGTITKSSTKVKIG
jgi:phage baseplate assembly protein gpV